MSASEETMTLEEATGKLGEQLTRAINNSYGCQNTPGDTAAFLGSAGQLGLAFVAALTEQRLQRESDAQAANRSSDGLTLASNRNSRPDGMCSA